ncbi:MAG: hypothetical protein V3U76_14060 [Granulosicoccus sp.]
MNRLIVATVAALFFTAGSAWAHHDEGCVYGQKNAEIAEIDTTHELIVDEVTDPKLLALIRKRQAERERLIIEQPIIQN